MNIGPRLNFGRPVSLDSGRAGDARAPE